MYESEDLKVLLGNSIEEPEVDYDDAEVASETGHPVEESALKQFYFVTITDHMSTPDFRNHYLSVIQQVRNLDTLDQQLLAFSIVQKLPEKYDFEFSLNFTPYNQDEINELYMFLEFVEFNHEKFITDVWKYLKPNGKINIEQFCLSNSERIMTEIEEQLSTHYFPELITDFLRTYNKENLIKWFCEKSSALYSSILLALREEF